MLSEDIHSFFLILQLAVGKHIKNVIHVKENDWQSIYDIATKQSLVGVMMAGIQKLSEIDNSQKPPFLLLCEWIGIAEQIKYQNKLMDENSAMLTSKLKNWGYDSCILKGQGVARLYPKPELRQSGDIDIWVNGSRDDVVRVLKEHSIDLSYIDYVNCHAGFFPDVEVEVHFRPTWFYNPNMNRKVQKWINQNKRVQMQNSDQEVNYNYPTIRFNLVFSLIHIYRHVFQEGIGLRQIMDYYYILIHSTIDDRSEAFDTIKTLGLDKFIAAVMYIERKVFNIDKSFLICEPNDKEGKFLLGEILRGGNFGHFDDRNTFVSADKRFKRGLYNVKRNFRYFKSYPTEVMWMPMWKVWHWGWRKYKGYL